MQDVEPDEERHAEAGASRDLLHARDVARTREGEHAPDPALAHGLAPEIGAIRHEVELPDPLLQGHAPEDVLDAALDPGRVGGMGGDGTHKERDGNAHRRYAGAQCASHGQAPPWLKSRIG